MSGSEFFVAIQVRFRISVSVRFSSSESVVHQTGSGATTGETCPFKNIPTLKKLLRLGYENIPTLKK
jgi:hypothetical protein